MRSDWYEGFSIVDPDNGEQVSMYRVYERDEPIGIRRHGHTKWYRTTYSRKSLIKVNKTCISTCSQSELFEFLSDLCTPRGAFRFIRAICEHTKPTRCPILPEYLTNYPELGE